MKISVCTDMLYRGMPTQEAMRYVKAAGADAVEFWGTRGKDLHAIADASRALELPVAVCCAPAEPALISPEGPAAFPEALKGMADACEVLGCRTLIAVSGAPTWGWSPLQMHDRLRAALEAAAPVLDALDLTLLLEPLNAAELAYLRSSGEAFDLCRMLAGTRVRVLYDIYHLQLMEGNLISTITTHLPLIGHFHVADVPGRTAPGRGEIHYPNVVRAIAQAGYTGYLGLEYQPSADNREEELRHAIALLRSGAVPAVSRP